MPALTNLVDWFIENRPQIEAFITQVREKVGAVRRGLCLRRRLHTGALGKVLGWIKSNKPVLLVLIGAIGIAIVTALGPVSLAVLAILGIITAIGYVRDNWDQIWNAILRVWESVSESGHLPPLRLEQLGLASARRPVGQGHHIPEAQVG